MQLSRVYRKLEQASFRVTPQRDQVIRTFANHVNEQLSAEDVARLLREEAPASVGLATIYRTIEILLQLQVLRRVTAVDGRSRFELDAEEVRRQHHLVCVRCGQVEELGENLLDGVERHILEGTGFRVMDHELKLYGVCRLCQNERERTLAEGVAP
jgi:Fur family ferric uptake transcriptional regulator